MTVLLALSFALQSDSASINPLLEQLCDESIEVRSKAEESIIRLARSWTKEDVEKLRKVGGDPDAERAGRARRALGWVEWFRDIPNEVWKAVPDLAKRLRSSDGEEIGDTLGKLREDKAKVAARALIPLLIGLLEDPRVSGQIDWYSSRIPADTLTVGKVAANLLSGVIPHFRREPTRKEALEWWIANRDKTERDWHLPDLSHEDEWVRAPAIRKLTELGDATLIPEILKTLPSFKDAAAFAYAVGGFSKFPGDTRADALKSHLGDTRFEARWAVAQVLLEPCRREALNAMIETFEEPSLLSDASRWPWNFQKVFTWLAASGDGKALEALFRFGRSGSGKCRVMALLCLRGVGDGRVNERLAEATADATTDWNRDGYDPAPMASPRVCDAAAFALSERLGIGAEFTWSDSIRTRNRNIETILNRWRRARGMPSVDYLGPGIAPVPAEKVKALVPDLISSEAGTRSSAIAKLSELGPGAWRVLLSEIERTPATSRSVLEESALRAANSLRSVVFQNPEAERMAMALKSRLYRPIDVDDLTKLIGEAWLETPNSGKLMCIVSRGADGIGISIRLSVGPPCPTGSRTIGVKFTYYGGSGWDSMDGGVPFRTEFRQQLKPIGAVLDRPDGQADVDFTVERDIKEK